MTPTSCYICGKQRCTPMFHGSIEQRAFEDAEKAYKEFLKVQKKCREEYDVIIEDEQ